jgi:monoamine oxidase
MKWGRLMSIYDEYQIVINEAQRRVIMRALTNAMAEDRHSSKGGALSRPTQDEYIQLVRLFSTIKPSVPK